MWTDSLPWMGRKSAQGIYPRIHVPDEMEYSIHSSPRDDPDAKTADIFETFEVSILASGSMSSHKRNPGHFARGIHIAHKIHIKTTQSGPSLDPWT